MNLGLLKRRELGFSIGDSSVIFGGVEDGFNISWDGMIMAHDYDINDVLK